VVAVDIVQPMISTVPFAEVAEITRLCIFSPSIVHPFVTVTVPEIVVFLPINSCEAKTVNCVLMVHFLGNHQDVE
jgi:hypothetical protein